jgi:serine/threonine protein kinase
MLRDFYAQGGSWQLVVLDFDLSWHRDANQRSVLHTSSAGYLAPEQMHRTPGVSTRSALVDSFGVGMTLLFLCRGTDPDPDEHRQVGWQSRVQAACLAVGSPGWASVPTRFARLIENCTQDRQSARWDLALIEGELGRLRSAVESPNNVRSVELLTEELASQAKAFNDYSWNVDAFRASRSLPTGLQFSLTADLQRERILLTVTWAATGVERGGIRKYMGANAKTAAEQLTASGWRDVRRESEEKSLELYANLPTSSITGGDVTRRLEEAGSQLDRALANIRF